MSRKKVGMLILSTLFLFGLLAGCGTQSEQQAPQTQEVISQKKDITLQSIEQEIKEVYGDQLEKVSISSNYNKDIALIEAKLKTAASCYFMYNMATGEHDQLPIEMSYANEAKIINENYVVLDMAGSNSETSFVEPPYRLHFRRMVEAGKSTFHSSKEKLPFQLDDSISFGDNIHDAYLLKDLRATLDGIQFSFQTASGEAAVFPPISTYFDESSRQFIIKAKKTKKGSTDYLSKLVAESSNIYVDSIRLEENNNTLSIILKLNKATTSYTAEIRNGSFAEICFSNR